MGAQSGRLLKKAMFEKLDALEIENYPWALLDESNMAVMDNTRQSVIISALHPSEELKEKIKEPKEFKQKLAAKSKIMQPLDLTSDYLKTQEELSFKKRRKMLDEDEAVAFEIAEIIERDGAEMSGSWRKKTAASDIEIKTPQKSVQPQANSNQNKEVFKENIKQTEAFEYNKSSSEPLESNKPENIVPEKSIPKNIPPQEINLDKLKQEIWQEAFAAGKIEGTNTSVAPQSEPESKADTAEIEQKAFNKGYEDGYKQGEERGELAGESQIAGTLELMKKIMIETENLRGEIIASGQDIFIEFTKIACEKIVKSQLAFHEDTLKNFLLQTVAPFLDKPSILLELSPQDLISVKNIMTQLPEINKQVKLKTNPTLKTGDFRVESENEVIVIDLRKSIEDMIDNLKGEIFSKPKSQQDKESA